MVEIDGQSLPFCNEECEGLYRSYWLPKYGGAASRQPSRRETRARVKFRAVLAQSEHRDQAEGQAGKG